MGVELDLLGRVRCRGEEITGPLLRGLFALLAADPRSGCGTARLVGELWPDGGPENPGKALQVLVSRARARFGADLIAATPVGYRLTLDEERIDAAAVLLRETAASRHARDGDHAAALGAAEAGLALCDGAGEWDAGPEGDPLAALRRARVPAQRSLLRTRALSLARLGRRAEAAGPLAEVVRREPGDEEALAELLRCEAAVQGPATALARYEAYRRGLRDDLGGDPGAALRDLHAELLREALPVVRRGVQFEPNELLGRDGDVAGVRALLETSRVVSIVGAGGLGKTRLAHAVARAAGRRTVYFVALAGVSGDADVPGVVASRLGAAEADPVAGVVTALGPGSALLVLDNCEHVADGAAGLVRALVAASGDVRVLTTSRAPLGLSSEAVYALAGLAPADAAELFARRARAARPGVALPAEEVERVCARLDGLPLAVELAAARVRVMSVGEIAAGLDDRFALLRGGGRDAPERHRTLHAVIDWSWRRLDPGAATALRALSVLPGTFGADTARRLLGYGEVLPVLETLAGQSLIEVLEGAGAGPGIRFRMLETVREFGAARRDELGETEAVTARFLAWARGFGAARHESIFSEDLPGFVAEARAEQDNLAQALREGLRREDADTVAATSAVLGGLWLLESNFARIAGLTAETAAVLARCRPGPELVEVTRTALVLCALNTFLVGGEAPGGPPDALRRFPAAPPDTLPRAFHHVLRVLAEDPGSLPALRDDPNPDVAGLAAYMLSYASEGAGDLDGALAEARRMLGVFAAGPNPWMAAISHGRAGELCLQADLGDEAHHHLTVALAAVERLGARTSATRARWALALANLQRGAVDETERVLTSAPRLEADGLPMFDVAMRAEITLARGDIAAGLLAWRRVAAEVGPGGGYWPLEVHALCVAAHARHGGLPRVAGLAAALPATVAGMIAGPVGFPACGTALAALALADLAAPGPAVPDPAVRAVAARMVALAERLRYLRGFQPTMSPAAVRLAAERADARAYGVAVEAYAGLDPAALRAAVLAVLGERAALTGPDRA